MLCNCCHGNCCRVVLCGAKFSAGINLFVSQGLTSNRKSCDVLSCQVWLQTGSSFRMVAVYVWPLGSEKHAFIVFVLALFMRNVWLWIANSQASLVACPCMPFASMYDKDLPSTLLRTFNFLVDSHISLPKRLVFSSMHVFLAHVSMPHIHCPLLQSVNALSVVVATLCMH